MMPVDKIVSILIEVLEKAKSKPKVEPKKEEVKIVDPPPIFGKNFLAAWSGEKVWKVYQTQRGKDGWFRTVTLWSTESEQVAGDLVKFYDDKLDEINKEREEFSTFDNFPCGMLTSVGKEKL